MGGACSYKRGLSMRAPFGHSRIPVPDPGPMNIIKYALKGEGLLSGE